MFCLADVLFRALIHLPCMSGVSFQPCRKRLQAKNGAFELVGAQELEVLQGKQCQARPGYELEPESSDDEMIMLPKENDGDGKMSHVRTMSVMSRFYARVWAPLVVKGRRVTTILLLAILGVTLWQATQLSAATTIPSIFPPGSNSDNILQLRGTFKNWGIGGLPTLPDAPPTMQPPVITGSGLNTAPHTTLRTTTAKWWPYTTHKTATTPTAPPSPVPLPTLPPAPPATQPPVVPPSGTPICQGDSCHVTSKDADLSANDKVSIVVGLIPPYIDRGTRLGGHVLIDDSAYRPQLNPNFHYTMGEIGASLQALCRKLVSRVDLVVAGQDHLCDSVPTRVVGGLGYPDPCTALGHREPKWAAFEVVSMMNQGSGASEIVRQNDEWEVFLRDAAAADPLLEGVFQTADVYTETYQQVLAVDGAVWSIGLSLFLCFASVVVFTANARMTAIVMLMLVFMASSVVSIFKWVSH